MMLPLAFFIILGDASADAFGATAIVSMMATVSLGVVVALLLYMAHQQTSTVAHRLASATRMKMRSQGAIWSEVISGVADGGPA